MGDLSVREAWVRIPSEEERRAQLPPGAPASAYNFGFIPAMARLQAAHDKIGRALGPLFRQIMFEPGQLVARNARWLRPWLLLRKIANIERSLTQSFCVRRMVTLNWLKLSNKDVGVSYPGFRSVSVRYARLPRNSARRQHAW